MSNGLTQIRNRVFISYSRKDAKYLGELQAQMAYYVDEGVISSWDDTNIIAGDIWEDEIIQAINSTKVAVFLVSADFLASRFIIERELLPLLKAKKEEGITVVSVIVRACVFKDTPLGPIQAINEPSKPLSMLSRGQRDAVWLKLAERIKAGLQPGK